jgi:hypothetical protein
VDALWQRVKQSPSAGDYLSALAPGSELQASIPTGARAQQKNHFCLLSAQVMEMDWLELSRNGHRRAKIAADGTLNSWQWLTP